MTTWYEGALLISTILLAAFMAIGLYTEAKRQEAVAANKNAEKKYQEATAANKKKKQETMSDVLESHDDNSHDDDSHDGFERLYEIVQEDMLTPSKYVQYVYNYKKDFRNHKVRVTVNIMYKKGMYNIDAAAEVFSSKNDCWNPIIVFPTQTSYDLFNINSEKSIEKCKEYINAIYD